MNPILFRLIIAVLCIIGLAARELFNIAENPFELRDPDLQVEFGHAMYFWSGILVGAVGFALISLI